MEIKRKELIEAVKVCMPGVDVKNSLLQCSNSIVIDKGWLHTYNESISVSVPMDFKKLSVAVKAKEFYGVISKLSEDSMVIELADNSLLISCGKVKVNMSLLENKMKDKISEVLDGVNDWRPCPFDFKEALRLCKFYYNSSKMAGVFVSDNAVCSTDGNRINIYKMSEAVEQFFVSDLAVAELLKLGIIKEYALSSTWVHFKMDNLAIFSIKRMDEKIFPFTSLNAIVEEHSPSDHDISNEFPKELAKSVDRASAFYTDIDSNRVVKITIRQKNIGINSENAAGKYSEFVDFEKPFKKKIPEIQFYVENSTLKYVSERATEFYVKHTELGGKNFIRLLLMTDKYTHLMSVISV